MADYMQKVSALTSQALTEYLTNRQEGRLVEFLEEDPTDFTKAPEQIWVNTTEDVLKYTSDGGVSEINVATSVDIDVIETQLADKATKEELGVLKKLGYIIDDFGTIDNTGTTNVSTIIQNAIDSIPSNSTLYFTPGTYLLTTTINLKSDITIIGINATIKGVYTTPITLFKGTSISNVKIKNLKFHNGAREAVSDITSNRTIRFISCSNIWVEGCEVSYGYDWQLSFENSTQCHVRNHTCYGMGNGFPGGRDGIHFLDCDDCSVDGAYIESGDDCVGVTSETKTSQRIQVRNIKGKSEIASMVIFNEEGATTFAISDCVVDNIEAIASVRDVVRVESINGAAHTKFAISNIRGTSSNHGLYFKGADNVDIFGKCDITSTAQHGIYLTGCDNATIGNAVTAKATNQDFCGLQVQTCTNVSVVGSLFKESGLWGVQVLTSTDVLLIGVRALDNGGLSFASNTGGNLRVQGSTRVRIYGGIYNGSVSTSFYGILLTSGGGTDVIEYNAIAGGATNRFGYTQWNPKYDIATILSGTTSIVVNHGMSGAPNQVIVTPKGNIGAVWITSITSTQFTINCATAPGSNVDVSWVATRTQ